MLGLAAKLFVIAGPVIVYGTVAACFTGWCWLFSVWGKPGAGRGIRAAPPPERGPAMGRCAPLRGRPVNPQ